jgi:hypothetical protein
MNDKLRRDRVNIGRDFTWKASIASNWAKAIASEEARDLLNAKPMAMQQKMMPSITHNGMSKTTIDGAMLSFKRRSSNKPKAVMNEI